MSEKHTLFAITHSLYSGRARSYLIKNQIPFQELSTGHESFKNDILPLAKLPTIPTLKTPDGTVIRDGAAIIEYFEQATGHPCQPSTARQKVVSSLFDLVGTDGLLRPAMHYRWNFPDQNLSFLRHHFYYSQRDVPARPEKTERMMEKMRFVAGLWGVRDETKDLVESLYLELLAALDTHFSAHPYLLGGKPCIGDFGLIAPLYAHLGRDPYPARIMQEKAVRVYRWVERMNRGDADTPEFFEASEDYLPNDEIPATLIETLRILSADLLPETEAAAETINQWLRATPPAPGVPAERFLGKAHFSVRGQPIESVAQPYRFFQLQRAQDTFDSLTEPERTSVRSLLTDTGLADLLTIRLSRRLAQRENLEVWL
ncbi:MAG: glutathione S-transferase family protein [Candidatus Binatia bacterium]|nr:glutathione S-transferase family protein [Candidatus Binatia bacterium]MDG1959098.1 glutathione S-transferase family protein [Candidatus Binatia bacterium]MDG2010952.1 glutathione S-transferase family protein [Candidatus Binatia bacterium]